jgi:hypothetical protein
MSSTYPLMIMMEDLSLFSMLWSSSGIIVVHVYIMEAHLFILDWTTNCKISVYSLISWIMYESYSNKPSLDPSNWIHFNNHNLDTY